MMASLVSGGASFLSKYDALLDSFFLVRVPTFYLYFLLFSLIIFWIWVLLNFYFFIRITVGSFLSLRYIILTFSTCSCRILISFLYNQNIVLVCSCSCCTFIFVLCMRGKAIFFLYISANILFFCLFFLLFCAFIQIYVHVEWVCFPIFVETYFRDEHSQAFSDNFVFWQQKSLQYELKRIWNIFQFICLLFTFLHLRLWQFLCYILTLLRPFHQFQPQMLILLHHQFLLSALSQTLHLPFILITHIAWTFVVMEWKLCRRL